MYETFGVMGALLDTQTCGGFGSSHVVEKRPYHDVSVAAFVYYAQMCRQATFEERWAATLSSAQYRPPHEPAPKGYLDWYDQMLGVPVCNP